MTDDIESHKSWFERLSHALLREPKDREQLIELLHDVTERQLIDHEALSMIEGVLQVSEMQVRDVMVPRPQMVVVEGDETPLHALPIIKESAHSRFPVIGESRDEILGILLAKDLLKIDLQNPTQTIRDLLRPATFIPESKRLDVLLKEFRQNRNHMAIVVDEYGGIAGLVTIEDVLEEIVGDIEDETDIAEEEPSIKQVNDNEYLVKALTEIEDFNAYFGTDYENENFDTIGGIVLHHFSHLPKPGEALVLDNFQVTVVQATSRGITLLRFNKQEESQ